MKRLLKRMWKLRLAVGVLWVFFYALCFVTEIAHYWVANLGVSLGIAVLLVSAEIVIESKQE